MKPIVTQIECHVAHQCNFSCVSCSHFSNDNHSGRLTTEQFKDTVAPWACRIAPRFFLVLGGEPTLNPDLCDILEVAVQLWDRPTKILLVTNGWFLHKHPRLADVIKNSNYRIRLDITVHHTSDEYRDKLDEIVRMVRSWGIDPCFRDSHRVWALTYKGSGKDIQPFEDNDPQASWKTCVSKECLQIHEGKLWKCPQAAYLPMQAKKYGPLDPKWDRYLEYQALDPYCTDQQLVEFVNRKAEDVCGMCPAVLDKFQKPNPMHRSALPLVAQEITHPQDTSCR